MFADRGALTWFPLIIASYELIMLYVKITSRFAPDELFVVIKPMVFGVDVASISIVVPRVEFNPVELAAYVDEPVTAVPLT